MSTRAAVRPRVSAGDMQARRLDRAAPHTTHSPGWPHLDRKGNCLCIPAMLHRPGRMQVPRGMQPPEPPGRPAVSGPYVGAERQVRAELPACKGSQLCNAPGCNVITQGGQAGADMHRQIVHPELAWT